MSTEQPRPCCTEEELHALVDGRLPAAEAAALRSRAQRDPETAATLAAWQSQREALRALHHDILSEAVPPALAAAATRTSALRERAHRWGRWGGMAASIALAFAAGWLVHGQWPAAGPLAVSAPARDFAHQAAVAHAVYVPEVRHAVEVTAAQQDHLVQWLSKRLGRPLRVPQLSAQGYELVGGRLLPGDDGARAQFMFQNAAGERVTLYVGAIKGRASSRETAFRFTEEGPVPGFYWVDQGFGYALAGKLPRSALLTLATAVHQQL